LRAGSLLVQASKNYVGVLFKSDIQRFAQGEGTDLRGGRENQKEKGD
jgi:hypothetical protein